MAARENQGYLIAVIILVLLTLVLGLLAFLGWSKAGEYAEGQASAKEDLKAEQAIREAHQIESEILRAYVGDLGESIAEVGTNIDSANRLANAGGLSDARKTAIQNVVARIKEVQAAYERDMQQFISRTEEDQSEEQTWSGVLRNLISVTARKHNELSVARQVNQDDKTRFESEKKKLEEQLKDNADDLAKTKEELQKVEKLSKDKEEKHKAEFAKAKREIAEYKSTLGAQISNLEKTNGDLASQNAQLDKDNKSFQRRIRELTTENFDIHDGMVVGVARNNVYLNIGGRDGLRTNQTFAVYDKSVNNFEKGEQKAKIEVIRITGPKSADARITEQDPTNPITRSDLIVTPTWDPGYRVPIAVAGVIDLDGDGLSDRLQFIRMLENNGGDVVCQHDEEGKITGEIDSYTRYLVMGDSPKLGPQGGNSEVYSAIRDLEKQAMDNAVQIIDLRKMMNRMGRHLTRVYKNKPRIDSVEKRLNEGSASRNEGSSTR